MLKQQFLYISTLLLLIVGCSEEPKTFPLPDSCDHYLALYSHTRELTFQITNLSHKDQQHYQQLFAEDYGERLQFLYQHFEKSDADAITQFCQNEGEEVARINDELLFLIFAGKLAQ